MHESRNDELVEPFIAATGQSVATPCWTRAVIAVGIAITLELLAPVNAGAGTYVMRTCDVPGFSNGRIGPWQNQEGGVASGVSFADECARGAGMNFKLQGARQMAGHSEQVIFLKRPSSGPQSRIALTKAVYYYSARLTSSGGPLTVFLVDGSNPLVPQIGGPGGENLLAEQVLDPSRTDYIAFGLRCDSSGLAQHCFPAHQIPLQVHGIAVTLREDVPPFASPLGGTLLSGGPKAGEQTATYEVSDSQSGLAYVEVLAGDTIVASRDLTSRCPFDDFTVCPLTDKAELTIDTRTLRNGSYPLSLRVKDAADNALLVRSPNRIEILNTNSDGSAGVSTKGSSTSAPERLAVRFAVSSRSKLTVPFGRRVRIRGRLTERPDRGIANARIEVFEKSTRPGARERGAGTVPTSADGTFSYVVARGRPSRAIRLVYRTAAGQIVSRTLRLRVRAASSLRASLRGAMVRFTGRVLSRPLPKFGKRVVLQGKAPGYTWATFAADRTDRTGRFAGRYRLPVRRPGVRLQIRVVVPTERGYPYLSFSGRPVPLRVR